MTTRDEVLAMAREAGIKYRHTPVGTNEMWCYDDAILRFAALVAAKEREECAKDKERLDWLEENHFYDGAYGPENRSYSWKFYTPNNEKQYEPIRSKIDLARSAK